MDGVLGQRMSLMDLAIVTIHAADALEPMLHGNQIQHPCSIAEFGLVDLRLLCVMCARGGHSGAAVKVADREQAVSGCDRTDEGEGANQGEGVQQYEV
jgi:hypothetical protein